MNKKKALKLFLRAIYLVAASIVTLIQFAAVINALINDVDVVKMSLVLP